MNFLIFTQFFLNNLIKSMLSIGKIFFLSKWNIKLNVKRNSNEIIILGNGPSLNQVLKEELNSLIDKDLLCVNYFADSEYYESIKPRFYLINAPELWSKNVLSSIKENSERLFKQIGKKTTWELTLFLPFSAKKMLEWKSNLGFNQKINIEYYNTTPIEGFVFWNNLLFKFGFGMPRPHNVIIPSLIVGIRLMYKNIYLLGVDHSWLKEITVDNENNVLINQKHFYDINTSKPETMHKLGVGKRKLHEVLQKFVYSFKGYFDIQQFAHKQNINVYNCTPGSFIDAFERKKLNEII